MKFPINIKINFIFLIPLVIGFFIGNLGGRELALAIGESKDLSVPTININPDVYYPFDEILYLEGRAESASNVQVQFQKQGAKPLKFNVKSDANGEWVLAEKVPLEAGNWEVRVRTVEATKDNPEGRTSQWSNPRIFNVIITGITIGSVNIKFAFLSFIIIFLLLVGIAIAFYFTLKVRRLKSDLVSKEIREAHESVHEGVSHIRDDLLEELRFFESSEQPLSEEQLSKKEHLIRELDRLEREMEREISDIERRSGGVVEVLSLVEVLLSEILFEIQVSIKAIA